MENPDNMEKLIESLAQGAWIFDPTDRYRPLGFITKDTHNTYQYLITWYFNHKSRTPTKKSFTSSNLIDYLQPSYDPNRNPPSRQWIPVTEDFVKEHYPEIFENHTTRKSLFTLPEQIIHYPTTKTIKALYTYILREIPSLHSFYKTSEELLNMIVKQYEQETPIKEGGNPCCCDYRLG